MVVCNIDGSRLNAEAAAADVEGLMGGCPVPDWLF